MAHALEFCTTYQLALVVDTPVAERHVLQLNASLASHMAGADGPLQVWLERRRDEVDAHIVGVAGLAISRKTTNEDDRADVERIQAAASHILEQSCPGVDTLKGLRCPGVAVGRVSAC